MPIRVDKPLVCFTIRLSPDTIEKLPPASLTGERTHYVRAAIEEKIARDEKAKKRKAAKNG